MNFPLSFDEVDPNPRKHKRCLTCSAELHQSVISISGGAFWMKKNYMSGTSSDRMEAYLMFARELHGHGERVEVVDGVLGGQFRILFCSAACCKSFLNSIVDELESRISRRAGT